MNNLLEKVFETRTITTRDSTSVTIHSETSKRQCGFLQKIILENKFTKSIEIGCAYGISSLAIAEVIAQNGGSHTIIDKFEHSQWGGVGLDLIAQAGYSKNIEFHEDYCYLVLPKLLAASRKFDFAYIDSTKQLDWLMVDFFFLDKLLEINGVIVFDDVRPFPGIRKLLRYISQFPDYKVYDAFPKNNISFFYDMLSLPFRILPMSKKYLNDEISVTNYRLGINAHCVALQKINEDSRNWDWHKHF